MLIAEFLFAKSVYDTRSCKNYAKFQCENKNVTTDHLEEEDMMRKWWSKIEEDWFYLEWDDDQRQA